MPHYNEVLPRPIRAHQRADGRWAYPVEALEFRFGEKPSQRRLLRLPNLTIGWVVRCHLPCRTHAEDSPNRFKKPPPKSEVVHLLSELPKDEAGKAVFTPGIVPELPTTLWANPYTKRALGTLMIERLAEGERVLTSAVDHQALLDALGMISCGPDCTSYLGAVQRGGLYIVTSKELKNNP